MNISIILAGAWLIGANIIGILPSRDKHWRAAYILIAIGIPLLGYVTYENGPLIGLLCLAAGMSILRWPLIYLGRWVKRKVATK
ncbi:MAG: DUF2484 family protein [Paracoccaceae bacterium]|nr:hypothetical protein RB2150_16879 [Rhodobacterales bacterium HTCC2150] [Rhodobacteraceae bacterium HTCC2150]MDG1530811.1 DUF2484 family protein [Paracoccaceae bacterium]